MLKDIVETIRKKNTRWEGLVQLKELAEPIDIRLFKYYCDDSFWLIRWAVIEKIGDLKLIDCLDTLCEKLSDSDSHVKKNAKKAIIKCTKEDITPIIKQLTCTQYQKVVFCRALIAKEVDNHIDAIEKAILCESWIIANQLLQIVFIEKKEKIEKLLLKAVKIKTVQKHAIVMLALINSKKAMPHFLIQYNQGALKKHIIKAVELMDPAIVYPELIACLEYESVKKNVKEILIKIGRPCLPFIIQSIHKAAYTDDLLYCLKKTTITVPVYNLLEKKISKFPDLEEKVDLQNFKPK